MIKAPEPLAARHDLSLFDCGKQPLNEWLRSHASSNDAKGFTRVLVVCDGDIVVGFYGLAPTAVPAMQLSRSVRTGRHPDPIPAILLGQFAVDQRYAGSGIGSALLRHALERCVLAAETIGGRAVIVRAIDGDAETYWRSCGFTASPDDGSILFRSIETIATWLGSTRQ